MKSGDGYNSTTLIGPSDYFQFQRVVFIGLTIGLITSIIFHLGVKENLIENTVIGDRPKKKILHFIRENKFYQVLNKILFYVKNIFCYFTFFFHSFLLLVKSKKKHTLHTVKCVKLLIKFR